MLNVIIFGSPGAGKGTQSNKIIDKYHLKHLSTGDLFRQNISENTELGKKVKSIMDSGVLVPDEITIDMLEKEMSKHSNINGFIFDGFPRTIEQAKALDALLKSKNQKIDIVLQLDVDVNEVKNRIYNRAKVSGRADDAEDKLIKRIDEYFNKTVLVIPYYKEQNKLKVINGIGDIDSIFSNICNEIDAHKANN